MPPARRSRRARLAAAFATLAIAAAASAHPAQTHESARHAMRGLVLEVNRAVASLVVSHEHVPGVMPAMTMAFEVRDAKELAGVEPGMTVEFTLVAGARDSHAEGIRVSRYETAEQDPFTAERWQALNDIVRPEAARSIVKAGQAVPDFTLVNQQHRPISLSSLRGRVVAVNFIYTSCVLPQFCFRIANHFGALQRRFESRLAKDLVLLTVTFDPQRDTPEVLAQYATATLRADFRSWHFLTGAAADVRRVCDLFGVSFFQDDELMNHSSRTAVVDRHGVLVANIEGNRYTATQLGDLVERALSR